MSQPFCNLVPADQRHMEFLLQLDNKAEALRLTDWEKEFIRDLVDHPRGLDESQIRYVAALHAKYGAEL